MKKLRTQILLAAIFLIVFAVPVSAKVGSSHTTGASIPKYKNVVVKNVDAADFDRTLYRALLEAQQMANSSTQYKIVIPPGTYQTGRLYMIPSNTYLYAVGATINAYGTRVGMFCTNPAQKSENIIVEGGTWSTLNQNSSVDGTVIRLLGVKNMVLKNMTITTKRKSHIVEVADMNGFTMTGCTLSGNNRDSSVPYKNVQPKEALQLDVATKAAMPGFGTTDNMYNGKGCHKVLIKNNTFINCARGLGSHSGTGGGAERRPYTDITVTGNTIKNLLGEGIYAQDWRNCTITGNTISNCRQAGMFLLDAYNVRINKNKVSNVKRYSGPRKTTYDPRGVYGTGFIVRHSSKIYMDNNQFNKIYKTAITQEGNCKGNTSKGNKAKNIIKK